jgi:hypothetical protein
MTAVTERQQETATMDTTRFDTVARRFGSGMTRREALRGLVTGAAALTAGGVLLHAQAEDVSAKRRRKNKKSQNQNGGQTRFRPSGALCQNDGQCNRKQQQICEVPQNASNSDTRCCGAAGAVCGGVNADGDALGPFCCIGQAGVRSFVCSQSDANNPNVPGTCIPAPPDL